MHNFFIFALLLFFLVVILGKNIHIINVKNPFFGLDRAILFKNKHKKIFPLWISLLIRFLYLFFNVLDFLIFIKKIPQKTTLWYFTIYPLNQ